MIWGRTYKQAKEDKESKWPEGKNWYAWRPVLLEDGRWIWREWVWRVVEADWWEVFTYYYPSEEEYLKEHLKLEGKE